MTRFSTLLFLATVFFPIMMSSCVPLAVGAAAGYVARDNGYKVQSPIKKSDTQKDDSQNW
jgi:hypothetical protein